jgi:hypothetical protein
MRALWRIAGLAAHLLAGAAAVVAVLLLTAPTPYPPLRVAFVALVAVLSAVTLVGRFPLGLGPVAGSVAAVTVRSVGIVLAGLGAAVVIAGLSQGDTPSQRAGTGVPLATVVLAAYLAAFLAVTRRDGELPPRTMLTSVGLGLLAVGLFAAAVPVLPPAPMIGLAYLLIVAAAGGAAWLSRPAETGALAALLVVVTAGQSLFFAASVLYHYGPDAWMPYAGPGPLTPQAQVEQNRAEAIDPYVGPLVLGAVAAIILTGLALRGRLRARAGTASTRPRPA